MNGVIGCRGTARRVVRDVASSRTLEIPSLKRAREQPLWPGDARQLARQNTARERRRYYQYVIVGAGTTAKAAIEAILAVDPAADILMLTDEVCLPGGDVYRKDR